jgi:hypothetical protein
VARGFFPLDEELSLLSGGLTPRLVEDLTHLGTWMPFAVAARMLGRFTGVTVSEATARRWTEGAGAALVADQTAEVERLGVGSPDASMSSPLGPPLQQVSVDGAMVPLVGGEWTEVKTVAIGTVGERVWEQEHFAVHTHDLSYFSRRADHLTFSHLASLETHRRGTATAGKVLGIVDGADWEQGFLDDHRPDAVRILDWGHGSEHLARAGQALFGFGTAALSAWLDVWLHELRHGNPERVLDELRRQLAASSVPVQAREEVQGHLAYLEARREQIRYAEFAAAGYPIGSGMVESANKLVVEARLKGAGMHWASDHVNPLVALRAITCSGRWEETWPRIQARLRWEVRERQRQRRAERQAANDRRKQEAAVVADPAPTREPPRSLSAKPRTDVVQPSVPYVRRPAPDHPWRRPLRLAKQRGHACSTDSAKT